MRTIDTGCSVLFIKLAALISFAGGPLILADMLKPSLGVNVAFGISFLPGGLMVVGALTIAEDPAGRFERFLVLLGVLGAALLVPLQLWGAVMLRLNPQQPDHTLKLIGVVTGLAVSTAYIGLARKWTQSYSLPAAGAVKDEGPWSHE